MKVLFLILFTLFLILFQTVILPSFSWFAQCFDLVIIDILFLSLISTHYAMIFVIVIIGCIMDSISGAPFFYHVFSYVWIYIIVHLVKQFFFKKSIIFIFIISAVSVFIQHGLLLFSIFINQENFTAVELNFSLLIRQAFWGVVFIPPGIWLTNVFWQNSNFLTAFIQKQIVRKYKG